MAEEKRVLVMKEQGIMSIILNRPDKKNALSNIMYKIINDALKQADLDDEIRVVLIRGNGNSFTSGNDIADFLNTDVDFEDKAVVETLSLLASFRKPLVAAVHGHAAGIGTTMLFHCDLVVAAKDTVFSLPFVPLGLCPEAASSLLLPMLAGHQQAAELLMLGEPFNTEKAEKIGLLNRVVETREVKLQAMALCQKLASLPVKSVLLTKKLLKTPANSVKDRVDEELGHFADLLQSKDAKKAFQAFLSK